jgi:glycosyltransferase involved in cell wall biosynthesis
MKILIVSQYFRPENFRINEVVDSLSSRHLELTVLTGHPNYPNGTIYPGFNNFSITRKIENNIDVIRVPIILRGKRKISLFFNYLSFVISAVLFGTPRLYKSSFDLIYCYAPSPIFQALPCIFFSWFYKIPFVFNVQDLWPQSLVSTGYIKNKLVLFLIDLIVSFIYRHCDVIVVSSQPFIQHIMKYNTSAKIVYIPNSVDNSFLNTPNDMPFDKNNFICVFAGNFGYAQSIDTILNAALLLKNNHKIKFRFYGAGSRYEFMKNFIKTHDLQNISLKGQVPSSEMPQILASASCLIVSLKDTEIFRATVPNKLQAYLAIGRPILGSLSGEGAKIIMESKSGLVASPDDDEDLASKLLELYECSSDELKSMGNSGRNYFVDNFENGKLINDLIELFNNVGLRN